MLQVLLKHALAGAFDSDEAKILTDAFDQAWWAIEQSGVCFSSDAYKNATRELLALRIIEIAQLGERDPNRLREDALLYLTRQTSRAPACSTVTAGVRSPSQSRLSDPTAAVYHGRLVSQLSANSGLNLLDHTNNYGGIDVGLPVAEPVASRPPSLVSTVRINVNIFVCHSWAV
jgi:hypothetical protein